MQHAIITISVSVDDATAQQLHNRATYIDAVDGPHSEADDVLLRACGNIKSSVETQLLEALPPRDREHADVFVNAEIVTKLCSHTDDELRSLQRSASFNSHENPTLVQ